MMGYFPMCVDIEGKKVYLVGQGEETEYKLKKLKLFSPEIIRKDALTEEDFRERPALVVIGDTEVSAAKEMCGLCGEYSVPVNVVDVPALCTFVFPAIISEGDLTISVSSGGKIPAVTTYLRRKIEEQLPEATEEIIAWLSEQRPLLRQELPEDRWKKALREMTAASMEAGRILSHDEVEKIKRGC